MGFETHENVHNQMISIMDGGGGTTGRENDNPHHNQNTNITVEGDMDTIVSQEQHEHLKG